MSLNLKRFNNKILFLCKRFLRIIKGVFVFIFEKRGVKLKSDVFEYPRPF